MGRWVCWSGYYYIGGCRVYVYRLQAGNELVETRKMALVR